MRIAMVLTPPTDKHFAWAAQVGVSDFVCRYPPHYGLDPIDGLTQMKSRAESFGLKLTVIEGFLPLDGVIHGRDSRDAQIAEAARFITHMGRLGVQVLCYNWMPTTDWVRTCFTVKTRGGALTNSFDAALLAGKSDASRERITADRLWDNLAYFLKKIVPVAEAAGVKLAMHPDDPPLDELLGSGQIMHTPDAFERLFDLDRSEVNGMTFCQGTFAETGVDIPATARRLAKRIHYVHFRDVRGTVPRFEEAFHDDGQTDMAAAMRTYHELGLRCPVRPDHVPRLEGEEGDGNGYTMLGRLFAAGYMRGLMHAVAGKQQGAN